MTTRKPLNRHRTLSDVMELLHIADLRPTDIRMMRGDAILSMVAKAYHYGHDVGVADAKDAVKRNREVVE